jgi:hypothetical protein
MGAQHALDRAESTSKQGRVLQCAHVHGEAAAEMPVSSTTFTNTPMPARSAMLVVPILERPRS